MVNEKGLQLGDEILRIGQMRVVPGLRHDAQRQPGVARQPLKFGVVLTAQHLQRHAQLAQLRRQIGCRPSDVASSMSAIAGPLLTERAAISA